MIDPTRLRELLAENNMSQAQLARALGVSPPAIQQILSGKTKRSRLGAEIANLFSVSLAWLNGTSDSQFLPVSGTLTPDQLVEQLRIKVHSGRMTFQDTDNPNTDIVNDVFRPAWLIDKISRFDPAAIEGLSEDEVPSAFVVVAATDAMSPTIEKGDEVLISLWTSEVEEPDAIWWLEYGGLRMIRRLMPIPGGGFRVSADNPKSPTFEAPAKEISVLGRAFWLGRTLV